MDRAGARVYTRSAGPSRENLQERKRVATNFPVAFLLRRPAFRGITDSPDGATQPTPGAAVEVIMYSFITGQFPNRDGSVIYTHVSVFAENQYAPNGDGTARVVGTKSASRSFTSADAMLSHAKGILGGPCVINGASVVLAPAAPAAPEKPAKGK